MNTAVINLKVEPKLKKDGQKLAKGLGLSLSTLLKSLLSKAVREKKVELELVPTPYLEREIQEALGDIKAGRVSPAFDTIQEELAWLKDPNARFANGDPVRQ